MDNVFNGIVVDFLPAHKMVLRVHLNALGTDRKVTAGVAAKVGDFAVRMLDTIVKLIVTT